MQNNITFGVIDLRCCTLIFVTMYIDYYSRLTNWFTCENVGLGICNLSEAIRFRAVLSKTT